MDKLVRRTEIKYYTGIGVFINDIRLEDMGPWDFDVWVDTRPTLGEADQSWMYCLHWITIL